MDCDSAHRQAQRYVGTGVAGTAASVFERLSHARDAAYAAVDTALGSDRVRALMLDLTEWLTCGAWRTKPSMRDARDASARHFAAGTLHALFCRVSKRGRSPSTLEDEERHEIRKTAKRLRYGAEFLGSVFSRRKRSRRYGNFVGSLEELQEQLGALNDMATARAVLDRFGLRDDPVAKGLLVHRKKSKTSTPPPRRTTIFSIARLSGVRGGGSTPGRTIERRNDRLIPLVSSKMTRPKVGTQVGYLKRPSRFMPTATGHRLCRRIVARQCYRLNAKRRQCSR
ncbi:CHAD domain-containing protein [Sphingomonas sp. OK281]|uniref:CHAD domain-containing protein n=1 Tax=Sphingomonas sp. OK281 TaxID=1881067 RepID=UPI0008E5BD01|nr:CHAD domain-containing protein [Sphingomonas sp. OK281]